MDAIKKIGQVVYWLVVAVLVVVGIGTTLTVFDLAGGTKLLAVKSGSMEPTIGVGSLIVTRPAGEYGVGDIITFTASAEGKETVTHRVTEVTEEEGEKYFVTKGDANESPDAEKVLMSSVIGKTVFTLPYLGYPVEFAKTKEGLIIMIVIPATIIIYSEIVSIKKEVIEKFKRRKESKPRDKKEPKEKAVIKPIVVKQHEKNTI